MFCESSEIKAVLDTEPETLEERLDKAAKLLVFSLKGEYGLWLKNDPAYYRHILIIIANQILKQEVK